MLTILKQTGYHYSSLCFWLADTLVLHAHDYAHACKHMSDNLLVIFI